MSNGIEIDLMMTNSEQDKQIVSAAKVLTEYLREMEEIKNSVKETLDLLVQDLHADKESAKGVKKYVKLLAKHNFKQDKENVVTGNAILETWLEKLDRNLVDQAA